MNNVVLITGVSGWLGARLAERLGSDEGIERVLGVDTVPPTPQQLARFGRTEFVRADVRHPLLGRVLAQARVDTVVHPPAATPTRPQLRLRPEHVAGVRSLLSSIDQAPSVTRLVLGSTTAVYGAGAADESVHSETSRATRTLPRGSVRRSAAVEAQARAFTRAHGQVATLVLRLAPLVGPTVDTWLTRYLRLPVLPTPLGRDPRVQVLHEDDAVAALLAATLETGPPHSAVLNVAAPGAMPLSRLVRQARRPSVPVLSPRPCLELVGRAAAAAGLFGDVPDVLRFGRVVDVTAFERRFGPVIRHTTAAALDAFFAATPGPAGPAALTADALGIAENVLRAAAARRSISVAARLGAAS